MCSIILAVCEPVAKLNLAVARRFDDDVSLITSDPSPPSPRCLQASIPAGLPYCDGGIQRSQHLPVGRINFGSLHWSAGQSSSGRVWMVGAVAVIAPLERVETTVSSSSDGCCATARLGNDLAECAISTFFLHAYGRLSADTQPSHTSACGMRPMLQPFEASVYVWRKGGPRKSLPMSYGD